MLIELVDAVDAGPVAFGVVVVAAAAGKQAEGAGSPGLRTYVLRQGWGQGSLRRTEAGGVAGVGTVAVGSEEEGLLLCFCAAVAGCGLMKEAEEENSCFMLYFFLSCGIFYIFQRMSLFSFLLILFFSWLLVTADILNSHTNITHT